MALVYRTNGAWGVGKGSNLTPAELDGNFYQLVQDIAVKAAQGVGLSNAIVTGSTLYFVLTDHTMLGPYTLPVADLRFVGEWLPSHSYLVNDIFTEGGATYIVIFNHTSQSVFVSGANDGHGNDYYRLLLASPAATGPWDFGFSFSAEPSAGTAIQIVPVTRDIVIPADMAGSIGACGTAPTEDYVIAVTVDGNFVGSITIDSSGDFTFSTEGHEVGISTGSVIRFMATSPDSPPLGIADTACTVLANQAG